MAKRRPLTLDDPRVWVESIKLWSLPGLPFHILKLGLFAVLEAYPGLPSSS